jgi:hypothetical protein
MSIKPLLCSFLLAFIFQNLYAQDGQPRCVNGVQLTFEEDQFLEWFRNDKLDSLNEDRNYTLGFGIGLTSPKTARWYSQQKRFHKNWANDILVYPMAEWSLKLAGFSPDSLRAQNPVIGDRPYSSIILLSLSLHKINATHFRGKHHTLSIGAIGVPGVAEYLQTEIHKMSNDSNTHPPYNPEGWDHQISHGGEPVVLLENVNTILLTKKAIKEEVASGQHKTRFGYDVKAQYGYMAGYLVEGFAGLGFRAGMIDLAHWDAQPGDHILSLSHLGLDEKIKAEEYYRTKTKYEAYVFASATTNIVLYNALLFGQFRHSDYRTNYFDHELYVIHGRAGIALASPHFQLSAFFAGKTPEINTPKFSRPHYWFAVSLLVNWSDVKK